MGNGQDEALKVEAAGIEVQAAAEKIRPSYIYRPALSIDGNQWCALYGANLQDGVAGFGDSPDEAYRAFDKEWTEKLPSKMKCECGHYRASHFVDGHCCACRCTQFIQVDTPADTETPVIVPPTVHADEGNVCTCGHKHEEHRDTSGCLFLLQGSYDPANPVERIYCKCLMYTQTYTQADTLATSAPEPAPEPEPGIKPDYEAKKPRVPQEGDCEIAKRDKECPWDWKHDGKDGVPCDQVSSGKPCGLMDAQS